MNLELLLVMNVGLVNFSLDLVNLIVSLDKLIVSLVNLDSDSVSLDVKLVNCGVGFVNLIVGYIRVLRVLAIIAANGVEIAICKLPSISVIGLIEENQSPDYCAGCNSWAFEPFDLLCQEDAGFMALQKTRFYLGL